MESVTTLEGVAAIACARAESEVATLLIENARALLTAPVAMAVLVDDEGSPDILVHCGISVDDLAKLPHLPSPVGLVSVTLAGTDLCLDDLGQDPRSAGLLDALGMKRLLAAPLWIEDRVVGAVFLTRHGTAPAFEGGAARQLSALCRVAAARIASLRRPGRSAAPTTSHGLLGPDRAPADVAGRPGPRWRPPATHLVHIQPIVDLRTRETVGFEALSRFPDARGTCRSPEVVFDEATMRGHGTELERRALERALLVLPALPATCYLSVNLSPQAILAPAVFAALSHALRSHPGRLVVELTEHAEVRHYPALVKTLTALRAWGMRLAVDDIGSGFANLRHVTMLHPDVIKLDGELVSGIHADRDRRAVAKAMIAFASEIGATFVAEGVETDEELDELRSMGAVFGQGYLLGRPAAPDRLLATTTPG